MSEVKLGQSYAYLPTPFPSRKLADKEVYELANFLQQYIYLNAPNQQLQEANFSIKKITPNDPPSSATDDNNQKASVMPKDSQGFKAVKPLKVASMQLKIGQERMFSPSWPAETQEFYKKLDALEATRKDINEDLIDTSTGPYDDEIKEDAFEQAQERIEEYQLELYDLFKNYNNIPDLLDTFFKDYPKATLRDFYTYLRNRG